MLLVSVIIPVFQSANTICETLDSVFAQTLPVHEVIVVDDGSTDNIDEVLLRYNKKIIYIKQKNLGAAAARNNGINHSTGEIIAFVDADDTWLPEKLALQTPLFNLPNVGAVYGNMFYLHDGLIQKPKYFDLYAPHRGDIFLSLFIRDYICFSTVLVRKKILDEIGYFDESLRYGEDYDLVMRISKVCNFECIESPVGAYRTSLNQMSKNYIEAAEYNLRLKIHVYKTSRKLFEGVDKNIIEQGLYNKYFRLVLCYMRSGRVSDAGQVLDNYRLEHRITLVYCIFRIISVLPTSVVVILVKIWDKLYQKPELGFV